VLADGVRSCPPPPPPPPPQPQEPIDHVDEPIDIDGPMPLP
jgi:hypothetical protein